MYLKGEISEFIIQADKLDFDLKCANDGNLRLKEKLSQQFEGTDCAEYLEININLILLKFAIISLYL